MCLSTFRSLVALCQTLLRMIYNHHGHIPALDDRTPFGHPLGVSGSAPSPSSDPCLCSPHNTGALTHNPLFQARPFQKYARPPGRRVQKLPLGVAVYVSLVTSGNSKYTQSKAQLVTRPFHRFELPLPVCQQTRHQRCMYTDRHLTESRLIQPSSPSTQNTNRGNRCSSDFAIQFSVRTVCRQLSLSLIAEYSAFCGRTPFRRDTLPP